MEPKKKQQPRPQDRGADRPDVIEPPVPGERRPNVIEPPFAKKKVPPEQNEIK
jgi:hypothetical protein